MSGTGTPVVVYTDGACAGNPGPGGWAWAVSPDGVPRGAGGARRTTNQRMEIYAVLDAVRTLPGPLVIFSDSTYVVNCFRDRWWARWEANGWRNSKKQPVANTDLWLPLVALVKERKPEFRWVKGHSGDAMNDLVDSLAVEASRAPFPPDTADPADPAGPASPAASGESPASAATLF